VTAAASGAVVNDESAGRPVERRPAGRGGAPPAFAPVEARGILRIPLAQQAGGIAPEPHPPDTVVRKGQSLIATTGNDIAAIAPVDGKVGRRIDVMLLNADVVPGVELYPVTPSPDTPGGSSDADSAQPKSGRPQDLLQCLERFGAAGIYADRRTSPNLIGQLIDASTRPIDTVFCSVLDGDPYLPLNSLTAATWPRELCRAVRLLGRITGSDHHRIVVDQSMASRWQQAIRAAARDEDLPVVGINNDYPMSDPTMLLHRLLGRRLRPRRLPTEIGVLLLDAPAAVAIGRLLLHDEPMTHVPVAVHDRRGGAAYFITAPIGMRLADLLEQLNLPVAGVLLRSGELLRDRHSAADAVIAAGELSVHLDLLEPDVNPNPCIRCGWCIEACPTRIHPAGLLEAAQQEDLELAAHYGLQSCIECGICSYVCPSRLPLLQGIHELMSNRENIGGTEGA
jgi:Na+-translocating ferredoxin:NAD+ oxidoreductase subunit C